MRRGVWEVKMGVSGGVLEEVGQSVSLKNVIGLLTSLEPSTQQLS